MDRNNTSIADSFAVGTPSDLEITVTRTFAAPRPVVFDAFTKPEIARRCMYGPDDWPLVDCTIDLRVGGALRLVWAHTETGAMGMSGTYREVTPPERTVNTELFDEDWTGGEAVVTTVFAAENDWTTVATTVLYASQQVRDTVHGTCIEAGWKPMYARLDRLLAETAGSDRSHGGASHSD